ncbi:hypothetical protein ACFL1Z_07085 [Thermodesulfobacteriota bacterium]
MARFSRVIPPGEEGWISLKVDTKGFNGNLHKSARVYSNDQAKGYAILNIRAVVKVSINVSVRTVNLTGYEGQEITRSVIITAGESKPLMLEPGDFNLADKLSYRIEQIEEGRKFKIHFTNVTELVGYYRGVLKLKTNYPQSPEIVIPIRVNIRKKAVKKENQGKT